jgi:type II secretory pathway pseudopilin PulG
MKKRIHIQAFTLPEVVLAIGVIALGLVGVFSILPYGLTAQKDNREETLIRYEAQYWTEVLLGEGLLLDELKRVERVESRDDAGVTYEFWNPFREVPDNNPGQIRLGRRLDSNGSGKYYRSGNGSLVLETAKKYWPSDVCGWLSKPAALNNATGNFALVKSLNGTLFDRSYGAEPETPIGPNEGFMEREFTMGYIMRVEPRCQLNGRFVAPDTKSNGSELRIGFYWPITEPILKLINNPQVSLRQIVSASMNQTSLPGGIPPRFNHHEFSFNTPKVLTAALTEDQLNLRERRFLKGLAGLRSGDLVTEGMLNSVFPRFESFPRKVVRDLTGTTPMYFEPPPAGDTFRADWVWFDANGINPKTSNDVHHTWPCRSRNGFSGLQLIDSGYKTHEIAWVNTPSVQPVFGAAVIPGPPAIPVEGWYWESGEWKEGNSAYKVFNPGNTADIPYLPRTGFYWISFLGPRQSWAEVLEAMSNSRGRDGPYPPRNPILDRDGNRYTLRQPLHLTTHRKIAADEQALLDIYGSRLFGNKLDNGWVTGAEAPRQYFLRKGIR